MRRDLRRLADTTFDVLVVGAGIYGATIAWEAAHRGLGVALIEKDDFGAATSFNSLKTVHGGLRSLQRGNLGEMREFMRERRALLRIAPHLVEPLRFVVPTSRSLKRNRLLMGPALAVYDLMARDRNAGLAPTRQLDPSRLMTRREVLEAFPGLASADVTGGASWSEGQIYNTDRLLLAFLGSASRAGASVANYARADGFLNQGSRVLGVSAADEVTGATFDIRARVTVNATGAWAAGLTDRLHAARPLPVLRKMSRAYNLVTRLPAPPCALGDQVDGRFVFCVPWRGIAVFGTLHLPHDGDPGHLPLATGEFEAFLRDLGRAFPWFGLRAEHVTLLHRGLLPMDGFRGGDVQLVKQSQIHDHRVDGIDGLMSVVGVRYTTARHTAERAVDAVGVMLGQTLPQSRSATTALEGGDIADLASLVASVSREGAPVAVPSATRLSRTYGTQYGPVLALMHATPALAAPLGADCAVTGAEVVHAVREEMALNLTDALLRRTEAGSAGHPGPDALQTAAHLLARELSWDDERTTREVAAVERVYALPA